MWKPYQGPTRPLILSVALASALLSQGCSSTPSAPTIKLTESQRAPCPTDLGLVKLETQADDDALTLRLAMLLMACSREKLGLVEVIDLHNTAVTPRPWWRQLFKTTGD